jgi:hypothetical protein
MDIYAQRVYSDGTQAWATNGISLPGSVSGGSQQNPQIAADVSGGAIVVWEEYRTGWDNVDLYAQRLDADGNTLWMTDGMTVCAYSSDQDRAQIVADGAGGVIATWRDERGTDFDIYAQRVGSQGNMLWATDGVTVCAATNNQDNPRIASDGAGGSIIAWHDARSSTSGYDIYAQRVDKDGNPLWATDGVTVCGALRHQGLDGELCIVPDGAGGAIVAWKDKRSGSYYDIYAQRVAANGDTLWANDGVSLCLLASDQQNPTIASDGRWGAIVAWQDQRGPTTLEIGPLAYTSDVYAQRVGGMEEVHLPLVAKRY